MYRLFGDGDALGLAVHLAGFAAYALGGIDDRTEHGKAGEETEGGSHRADAVAVYPAVLPCQNGQHHQCDGGNDQGRHALDPYFLFIEGIASGALGQRGQQIVAPEIDGLQKVRYHPAIGAVGGQQRHQDVSSGQQANDKQRPDAIAEPFQLIVILIGFFALMGPQPGNAVLEHAQGANHRAVHPAEDERQYDQAYHHACIQG